MKLKSSRSIVSYLIMNSPLFSILLLLTAFAASTMFLFVSWRNCCHLHNATESLLIRHEQTQVLMLNDTVLELAEIDLSDERTTSDVTELLTENFHRLRMEYWLWCVHNLVLRLNSIELQKIMVNVKKDLVNWSDRRYRHGRHRQSTPPLLLLNSAKLPHYSSCAVVGNSGILLNSEHGELIDSHESVIRVKNAKVNGFEKHVGTKTNISFINSNTYTKCVLQGNCNCNPYTPNTTLITYISQPIHFLDIALCNVTSIHPTLLVTDPEFDAQCGKIVKYYSLKLWMEQKRKTFEEWDSAHEGMLFHYSTGMQAVMLALRVCERVSLFGFGKGSSISTKHHYHTDQKSELRLHDYDAEYELYNDLTRSSVSVPFIGKEVKIPPVLWYR